MSQREPAQGASSSNHETGPQSTRTSIYQHHAPDSSSQRLNPPSLYGSRDYELPPLQRVASAKAGTASPSMPRSVNLPSVLNPLPEDTADQRTRQSDEFTSYASAPTLPPLGNASQGYTPSVASSGQSPLQHLVEPVDRSSRRILNARSPLRRTISLAQLNPASGLINAQHNPFPGSPHSGSYGVERAYPGASTLPPTPPPGVVRQGGYGFPGMVAPPRSAPGRASPERQQFSTSPSPAYSFYDSGDRPSPPGPSGASHSVGHLTAGDSHGGRGASVPSMMTSAPMGIPSSSIGGQNTYQMMTLKTTEGDVRFPVDVQAASRVADEKRRRNAGASARFRERRKKKEMEATATIAKLEQQMKDASEDADFYRQERDVLAAILRGMPGGERHLSGRAQSPRLRRKASSSTQPTASSSYRQSSENELRSPEMGRNVRRRTSSFHMAQMPAAIPQSFGQTSAQASQASYGQTPPQLPMVHQSNNPQQTLPSASQMGMASGQVLTTLPPLPPVLQAPPMTGPYNPFASRYDLSKQRSQQHGR